MAKSDAPPHDKNAGDTAREAGAGNEDRSQGPRYEPTGNPFLALLLAWLIPGGGHLYLGRRGRAVAFCGIVAVAVAVGLLLEGRLYSGLSGGLLAILGTVSHLFIGVLYLILQLIVGYEGNVLGAGYEYGTAFLVTAGLMNALLVLDAWDISKGYKE